jgi:hypothetical protein
MTTKNKTITGVCCFLLAAGMVAEARELASPPTPVAQSPYPVMDSGVWADWHGIASDIYWLDNNRILFKTVKDNDKRRVSSGPFNLSIWDTKTNKVTPYTENVKALSVCYREGFIYYTLEDESKDQRRFAGEFGKEKLFVPPNAKNARYNEMDCQFQADLAPAEKLEGPKRHDVEFLLHRHGYLDYGPRTEIRNLPLGKGKPILYYRNGQIKPVSLPITNEGTKMAEYYEFKDAYFIHELVGGGGRWHGDSAIAWWLFPDGKATEVKIPDGPYKQGGSVGLYPTRKGVFVRYDTFKSNKDPGEAGGYLVTGKNATRVIVGHLKGPVVSPDGCKIAFSYHAYPDATLVADPAPITLKTINFCPEVK